MQVLDIRELAQDWREVLDSEPEDHADVWQLGYDESDGDIGRTYDDNPESERSFAYDTGREAGEQSRKYVSLCEQLGVDATPDALEAYGDDYEPTMIAERDFEEYAQELAEDCAPFSRDSETGQILDSWPYRCIDWERAARELAYDYSLVTFDGTDYYIRSV